MERTDGVMKVTETRNFAGKEMEVTKTYVEGTKEAKQAAKARRGGQVRWPGQRAVTAGERRRS
jgi:hypothetical protein